MSKRSKKPVKQNYFSKPIAVPPQLVNVQVDLPLLNVLQTIVKNKDNKKFLNSLDNLLKSV